MNIKQKIVSGTIIAAMVAATVAPASFASTVKIKGNGPFSHNGVVDVSWTSNSVTQKSKTVAGTAVGVSTKTGKNSSSFNTHGTNTITTGPATNTVRVTVTGGDNTNTAPDCGCNTPANNDVTIQGNGPFSSNHVFLVDGNSNSVTQSNTTVAQTEIGASASTGGNSSSFNTGGDNSITTGAATNTVTVTVNGGSNMN